MSGHYIQSFHVVLPLCNMTGSDSQKQLWRAVPVCRPLTLRMIRVYDINHRCKKRSRAMLEPGSLAPANPPASGISVHPPWREKPADLINQVPNGNAGCRVTPNLAHTALGGTDTVVKSPPNCFCFLLNGKSAPFVCLFVCFFLFFWGWLIGSDYTQWSDQNS